MPLFFTLLAFLSYIQYIHTFLHPWTFAEAPLHCCWCPTQILPVVPLSGRTVSLRGASVCGRKLPSAGTHADQPSFWSLSLAKGKSSLWIPIILRFPLSPSWQTHLLSLNHTHISYTGHASKLLGCDVAKWLARLPACRKVRFSAGHSLSDSD